MEYRIIEKDGRRISVFNILMYWMTERQNIFWKRLNGEPAPWSDDEIFQAYKFTNVYRLLDRSSQFMLKNVIYDGNDWNEEDMIFRIMLYKFFNLPFTWEYMQEHFYNNLICLEWYDKDEFKSCLDKLTDNDVTIYSNAYMMTGAKTYGSDIKHHNHFEMFDMFFKSGKIPFVQEIMKSKSLKQLYKNLLRAKYVGPFLAMQLATDLNYSPLFDFNPDSFVIAGPGAKRGLQKLHKTIPDGTKYEDLIEDVMHDFDVHIRGHSFIGLEKDDGEAILPSLMDIQNCLCELDKYMRAYDPSIGTTDSRTRIKNTFKPTGDIEKPFIPPKWR